MKVYVCKEWCGDGKFGNWENQRVISGKQKAIEWVMDDFDNRTFEEFDVE